MVPATITEFITIDPKFQGSANTVKKLFRVGVKIIEIEYASRGSLNAVRNIHKIGNKMIDEIINKRARSTHQ